MHLILLFFYFTTFAEILKRLLSNMKKYIYIVLALAGLMLYTSCDNEETYAEKRDKELSAINSYISNKKIKVISESEFFAQDSTTDVSKNEYVLFASTGVYMQIVHKGCGEKIKNGETTSILCRFDEYDILDNPDTMQLTNNILYYSSLPEKMTVARSSSTFYGSFVSGSSLMYSTYGSTSVPNGWLAVFPYINIGRQTSEDNPIAKVNLIIPHSQGQAYASSNVYPCFYRITFERGK